MFSFAGGSAGGTLGTIAMNVGKCELEPVFCTGTMDNMLSQLPSLSTSATATKGKGTPTNWKQNSNVATRWNKMACC